MKIIQQPNLADYSSIHIGGLGNFLYMPENESELLPLLDTLSRPVVTGGGTNVVFAESFSDDVVSLRRYASGSIDIRDGAVCVAAGVKLSRAVYALSRAGWRGFETLAGIPGTIGGAVVMNAGSRYGCIGDWVTSVRALSMDTGLIRSLSVEDLAFSYRSSCFQREHRMIVLEVELMFIEKAPADTLIARVSEIIRERITSRIRQPNCGSIFRNPEHELTAGAMIDRLGLKGFSVGGVAVSSEHGNIFINTGGGCYRDFQSLSEVIRERVLGEFGVTLEFELRILS